MPVYISPEFIALAIALIALVGAALTRDYVRVKRKLNELSKNTLVVGTLETRFEDNKDTLKLPATIVKAMLDMIYESQPLRKVAPDLADVAGGLNDIVKEATDGIPLTDKPKSEEIPDGAGINA